MAPNTDLQPSFTFTVRFEKERKLTMNYRSLRRFAEVSGIDPFADLEAACEPWAVVLLLWSFAVEEDPLVDHETIAANLTIEAVEVISKQTKHLALFRGSFRNN